MFRNRFVIFFILANTFILCFFTILQIRERYHDTNKAISAALREIIYRNTLYDEYDQTISAFIESFWHSKGLFVSSHFRSKLPGVQEIDHKGFVCSEPSFHYKIDDYNNGSFLSVNSWISIRKDGVFFCSRNQYLLGDGSYFGYWTTGFNIFSTSTWDYVFILIIFSIVISIIGSFAINFMLKKVEKLKEKQVTLHVLSKLRHDLPKPMAKIALTLSEAIGNIGKNSKIKKKLETALNLVRVNSHITNAVFSYLSGKDHHSVKPNISLIDLKDVCELSAFSTFGDNYDKYVNFNIKVQEIFAKAECDQSGYLTKDQFSLACKNDRYIRRLLVPKTKSSNNR